MQYELDTGKGLNLNWSASGHERILQNVMNLIKTWRYEVAYNRTMGIDTSILDLPSSLAANAYIAEIYRIVPLYEPRANVKEVKYLGVDGDGNMQFKVVIDV